MRLDDNFSFKNYKKLNEDVEIENEPKDPIENCVKQFGLDYKNFEIERDYLDCYKHKNTFTSDWYVTYQDESTQDKEDPIFVNVKINVNTSDISLIVDTYGDGLNEPIEEDAEPIGTIYADDVEVEESYFYTYEYNKTPIEKMSEIYGKTTEELQNILDASVALAKRMSIEYIVDDINENLDAFEPYEPDWDMLPGGHDDY